MSRCRLLGCLLLCLVLGAPSSAAPSWTATLDSLNAGYGRANEARARGDLPEYLIRLEALHRLVPDWPWLVYRLAGAHALLGQRTEAMRRLEEALSLGVGLEAATDPALAPLWAGPGADSLRQRLERARAPVGSSAIAFRLPERDLFPEGIAYDPARRTYFLSSLYKCKIVAIDSAGTARDFTEEGQDSLWCGLGMKVDVARRRLWLASSEQEFMRGYQARPVNRAALFCYDLETRRLRLRAVPPSEAAVSGDEATHLLNDLVVTEAGDVYVTDTVEGSVYRADGETGRLERLLDPGTLPNANGIALDESRSRLYVAHAFGVARIDLRSREVTELSRPSGVTLTAIDGLYRVGDELLAMQTGLRRIIRLRLDPSGERVVSWSLLAAHLPIFREITTGVVVGDRFVYIGTSQYGSLLSNGGTPLLEELSEILIIRAEL